MDVEQISTMSEVDIELLQVLASLSPHGGLLDVEDLLRALDEVGLARTDAEASVERLGLAGLLNRDQRAVGDQAGTKREQICLTALGLQIALPRSEEDPPAPAVSA